MRPLKVRLVQYGILALIVIVPLVSYIMNPHSGPPEVPYSDLMKWVEQDRVSDVAIQGEIATGHLQTGGEFVSRVALPAQSSLVDLLRQHHAAVDFQAADAGTLWRLVAAWAPALVVVGALAYFLSGVDTALRLNAEKLDGLRELLAPARTVGGDKSAMQSD